MQEDLSLILRSVRNGMMVIFVSVFFLIQFNSDAVVVTHKSDSDDCCHVGLHQTTQLMTSWC